MRLLTTADKHLWRLALPMILSNITVPLLGLVDTAVIGHLDSPVYLGGVAVGTTVTSFLFMLLLFLRMSTTGLTAQAFGAQDKPALARALMQPLLLALLAGLLFIILKTPLTQLALSLTGGSEAVLHQAALFMQIRWLSAPATLANLVLLGWLLGVQYARAPVILLVVGNLVNILLDLWFVIGLGWGVQGAAAATAIAEYVSFIVGLLLVWRVMVLRGLSLRLLLNAWRGNLGRLLRLNRDIMLRSLLLQICFASLTLFGARLGSDVVAVNAVLLMFLTFTAYALDGFAYAVEACSGEAYGASNSQRPAQRLARCLPPVGGGSHRLLVTLCAVWRADSRVADLATAAAAAGRSLSLVAGCDAAGGSGMLSAGRDVYWRHARQRDAQRHGDSRGRFCLNPVQRSLVG
ncbi:putative MATE family efflux protein [Erwinia aphidicola]